MSLLYAVPDFCSSPSHNPGADLGGATRLGPPIFTTFAFMTILTVHNIDLKCLLCVYVTVKNNLTKQVLTSTHHTFGPPYSEILDPPLQPPSPSNQK